MRCKKLFCFVIFGLFALSGMTVAKPNIIFIMCDDLG